MHLELFVTARKIAFDEGKYLIFFHSQQKAWYDELSLIHLHQNVKFLKFSFLLI